MELEHRSLNWNRFTFGLLLSVAFKLHLPATCSNILLLPFAFHSHVTEMAAIGTDLQEKGHNIHILLPESYPGINELKSRFNLVIHAVKYPDFYSRTDESDNWMETAKTVTPIQEFRIDVDGFIELCTNPLEDDSLPERLGKLRPDLAIVDGFPGSRCLYAIAYKLRIPYVTLTTQYEPWLWRNPALPSFVPFPLAGIFTERMTLFERIQNLYTLVDWTAWPGVPYMEDNFIKRYLPNDPKVTYSWLAAKSLLWLIDSDIAIDYPRPTMPNEIHIGGLSTRPANQLPTDLEKFANGAPKGLIVVSFGSSGILDDEDSFKILISVFSRLEQHVVWKYSSDIPEIYSQNLPSNVLIMKWLPQNDLLGHPNCRLFVTHCGANGQFEALYHAIPMLGLPVFADQPYNARRMEYLGYGRFLEFRKLTSENLFHMITEMLTNSSYLENIRRGSAIFRDRTQAPKERAVWWIEHVLVHGGRHLHSFALDMPWYEYLLLDVLVLVVIIPMVMITSVLSCVIACILYKCRSSEVKQKQN